MRRLLLLAALMVVGILSTASPASAVSCTVGPNALPNTQTCLQVFQNVVAWQFRYGEQTLSPSNWTRYSSGYDCWWNSNWSAADLKQRCTIETSWYHNANFGNKRFLVTHFNVRRVWAGDFYYSYPQCGTSTAYPPALYHEFSPTYPGGLCVQPVQGGAVYYYHIWRMAGDFDEWGGYG